jgi:hypothetical protein
MSSDLPSTAIALVPHDHINSNPGTVVVWCEMFASPDIIESWAAFTCESVVVCATFASPENAFC